jgi:hypothetical protein
VNGTTCYLAWDLRGSDWLALRIERLRLYSLADAAHDVAFTFTDGQTGAVLYTDTRTIAPGDNVLTAWPELWPHTRGWIILSFEAPTELVLAETRNEHLPNSYTTWHDGCLADCWDGHSPLPEAYAQATPGYVPLQDELEGDEVDTAHGLQVQYTVACSLHRLACTHRSYLEEPWRKLLLTKVLEQLKASGNSNYLTASMGEDGALEDTYNAWYDDYKQSLGTAVAMLSGNLPDDGCFPCEPILTTQYRL